jgi:hypothetical protein
MNIFENTFITLLSFAAAFFLSAAAFLSAAISAGLFAVFFASDIANFAAFFSLTSRHHPLILR